MTCLRVDGVRHGWCCWIVLLMVLVDAVVNGAAGLYGLDQVEQRQSLASPRFSTRPQVLSAEEGGRVSLQCHIADQGSYVVVWKRGRRVLSARDTVVTRDRRFRLAADHSLTLSSVRAEDAGNYSCVLDTDALMELTHQLVVLYGPRVSVSPSEGVLVVQQFSSARLRCNATGNPAPTVHWRKQVGALPPGEMILPARSSVSGRRGGVSEDEGGGDYWISRVERLMAGIYECVADNGRGATALATLRLRVQYPPEVVVARSSVFSGEGRTATLSCLVHSDPRAEVVWQRGGGTLDVMDRRYRSTQVAVTSEQEGRSKNSLATLEEEAVRHSLTVKHVTSADFSLYTCMATNQLGKTSARILLTGTPSKATVVSPAVSMLSHSYQLGWQVTSYLPLLEYRVAYRHYKYKQASISTEEEAVSSWREVLVPFRGSETVNASVFRQRIPLAGLRPASVYDVHVKCRNRHGWGPTSDTFKFSTLESRAALESRDSGAAVAPAAAGDARLTMLLAMMMMVLMRLEYL